jgi:hypothetical protein
LGISLPQLAANGRECSNLAVESIVTAAHDFDEMVDLLALSRPFERSAGMAMAHKVATLPLRDAITLVVEDWADDKFRQLSAVIVRRSAPTIRSFEEIRHLYEKAETAPAS